MEQNIFTDRLGNKHIKPQNIDAEERTSVCGVAIKDGQILLIKAVDFIDWEIPGGKVEPGETIEEGLVREFLEETGYVVTKIIENFYQKKHDFYSIKRDLYYRSMVNFFTVEIDLSVQHKEKMTFDEVDQVKWFDLNSLDIGRVNPFHKGIIELLRLKK